MPQRHASRTVVVAVAALVLTAALAGCGNDEQQPATAASPSDTATSSSSPRRTQATKAPETGPELAVTVAGSDVSPTARTIRMSTGDVLTLQITSDRPGELHVHSTPEQYVDFGRGESRHEIELETPGQIDVEEHDSGALVARLLVS
jgi:glucose/arabinose dehydrogenase